MNETVKKQGITFGITVGVLAIVCTTLMYVIDISLFVSFWTGSIIFIINLVLAIIAVAKVKKAQGGYASFKEAFTTFFIVMAIGSLINALYMFVLFNLIDPTAKTTVTDLVVQSTAKMMQGIGAKTADIKATLEEIKNADSFGLLALLKSYVYGLIFYIIVGLIVAAAMKKQDPFAGIKQDSLDNPGQE